MAVTRHIKVKVATAGDFKNGKSYTVKKIINNYNYEPSCSPSFSALNFTKKQSKYLVKADLMFTDISSNPKYLLHEDLYYKNQDYVLLVVNINETNAFESLIKWLDRIKKTNPDANIILIKNQIPHLHTLDANNKENQNDSNTLNKKPENKRLAITKNKINDFANEHKLKSFTIEDNSSDAVNNEIIEYIIEHKFKNSEIYNRPHRKLADACEIRHQAGAENQNLHLVHEDSSTALMPNFAESVEFPMRSNMPSKKKDNLSVESQENSDIIYSEKTTLAIKELSKFNNILSVSEICEKLYSLDPSINEIQNLKKAPKIKKLIASLQYLSIINSLENLISNTLLLILYFIDFSSFEKIQENNLLENGDKHLFWTNAPKQAAEKALNLASRDLSENTSRTYDKIRSQGEFSI